MNDELLADIDWEPHFAVFSNHESSTQADETHQVEPFLPHGVERWMIDTHLYSNIDIYICVYINIHIYIYTFIYK